MKICFVCRNKTGGKLVFSIEKYDGDGFFLEQSRRFSHSKKYIESLCETFGHKLQYFETQALRREKISISAVGYTY